MPRTPPLPPASSRPIPPGPPTGPCRPRRPGNRKAEADYVPIGMAIDPEGNVVVAGWFYGEMQLGTVTLETPDGSSNYSAYVAKFDPTGNVLFAKSFGDGADQYIEGVAVDAAGNIFLTGEFESTISFGGTTNTLRTGLTPTAWGEYSDRHLMFVAKLDPQGEGVFSKAFGQVDGAVGPSTTGGGYLHGAPREGHRDRWRRERDRHRLLRRLHRFPRAPATAAAQRSRAWARSSPSEPGGFSIWGGDAFVAKFTNSGDYVFARSFGTGGSTQYPVQIAVDRKGDIVDLRQRPRVPSTSPGMAARARECSRPPPSARQARSSHRPRSSQSSTRRANTSGPRPLRPKGWPSPTTWRSTPEGTSSSAGSFTGSADVVDSGYVADALRSRAPTAAPTAFTPWNAGRRTAFVARLDGDGGREVGRGSSVAVRGSPGRGPSRSAWRGARTSGAGSRGRSNRGTPSCSPRCRSSTRAVPSRGREPTARPEARTSTP